MVRWKAAQPPKVDCRTQGLSALPKERTSCMVNSTGDMAMEQAPHQTNGDDQHKRLLVGWFSFTCCEDSTILLTELLNDHLDEWRKVVEFRHIKALRTNNSLAE